MALDFRDRSSAFWLLRSPTGDPGEFCALLQREFQLRFRVEFHFLAFGGEYCTGTGRTTDHRTLYRAALAAGDRADCGADARDASNNAGIAPLGRLGFGNERSRYYGIGLRPIQDARQDQVDVRPALHAT